MKLLLEFTRYFIKQDRQSTNLSSCPETNTGETETKTEGEREKSEREPNLCYLICDGGQSHGR